MAQLRAYLRLPVALSCCAALATVGGCRNLDNAQTDVLERELRQQEDYIYELEDYLIEYSEKLRQARLAQCPPEAVGSSPRPSSRKGPLPNPTIDDDLPTRPTLPLNGRNKVTPPSEGPLSEAPPASALSAPATNASPAAEASAAEPPTSEAPAAESAAPAAEQPDAEAPDPEPVSPDQLEAPALEVGPVGSLPAHGSKQLSAAGNAASPAEEAQPLVIPDPVDYQADSDEIVTPADEPREAAGADSAPQLAAPQNNPARLTAQELKVRRVFLEPSQDDQNKRSLLIVVEAVNATEEPVEAIGAASIMIMARDEAGGLRRVERWDFTAEETAAAWQSSHLGDGLHLELPLAHGSLPEGGLELWARVVANDGGKLLTSADEPYQFEATQLASMAEAAKDSALADSSAAPIEPAPSPTNPSSTATTASIDQKPASTELSEPKPQWRASSVRLEKDRDEGLSAAAGAKPAAWSTTASASSPRVASAASADKAPTWKRSTRAAADTQTAREWSAER